MKAAIGFIVLALSAQLAQAGSFPPDFPQGYTKILLPVTIDINNPLADALGVEWATHVAITNSSGQPVSVVGSFFEINGIGEEFFPPDIPGNFTIYPEPLICCGGGFGGFLYVESGRESDVHVSVRLQKVVGFEAAGVGTELPVVPAAQFLTTSVALGDIPLTAETRVNLRIYDLNPSTFRTPDTIHSVRVRLFAVDTGVQAPPPDPNSAQSDQLLFDHVESFPITSELMYTAGEIYMNLSALPELSGVGTVRAEITPADSNPIQFWGFASVTDNATQQVTIIAPR